MNDLIHGHELASEYLLWLVLLACHNRGGRFVVGTSLLGLGAPIATWIEGLISRLDYRDQRGSIRLTRCSLLDKSRRGAAISCLMLQSLDLLIEKGPLVHPSSVP